jgi:GH15 family glucan-1,4-alpha-glucosidase
VTSLDLALVGNGALAALIAPRGEIAWACFPRFDGDPVFCTLLRERQREDDYGFFAIELLDFVSDEQEYVAETPMLVTRLHDRHGGSVEITDFLPRSRRDGRLEAPRLLIRRIRPLAGQPRIRVRVRPACDYGRRRAEVARGPDHLRYSGGEVALRLSTDLPIAGVAEEYPLLLEREATLVLGPDEPLAGAAADLGRAYFEATRDHWREWVRSLALPSEWQDAAIRAAITLELNACEETGAIIAAMTTSIPEAAGSARNWDYRYCWPRDAYFVGDALYRLGATRALERYVDYLLGVLAGAGGAPLQPVYAISGESVPEERVIDTLPGYRGMGPVRVGNQAAHQTQHDVYGWVVLAVARVLLGRKPGPGDTELFRRLEPLGERAATLFDRPDAGLWELRGAARVHTFSSVMCWAACDRPAKCAAHLGLADRAAAWGVRAEHMHRVISERAWNPRRASFVATMGGGDALDASLLLLPGLGFIAADDPRFAGTVGAIERELRRGDFIFRYVEADDFGAPENAFLVCTLWYVDALAALGRHEEARALFENVLACRNRHGLLAEHVDPRTREPWGNFVQTYSMAGLVGSAMRLSSANLSAR